MILECCAELEISLEQVKAFELDLKNILYRETHAREVDEAKQMARTYELINEMEL
jgi:hypothetical protein